MTEPEENKLYSELRRKLADYESPPPPAVWPGVQRHLATRRRPRAVAWLLRPRNLLLVAGVLSLLTFLLVQRPFVLDHQTDSTPKATTVTTIDNSNIARNAPTSRGAVPLASQPKATAAPTTIREASAATSVTGSRLPPTLAPAVDAATAKTPPAHPQMHSSHGQAARATVAARRVGSAQATAAHRVPKRATAPTVTRQRSSFSSVAFPTAAVSNTSRNTNPATLPLASPAPTELVAALPTKLLPVNQPTPSQPRRVPETPRDSAVERGWVVQVLAGPALTYRALGAAPAGSVARLERPALAYGGQVQVGYTFSSRLLVTAGLGYADYATRLKLELQNDSAVRAVRSRDVYRFLQVPVQARYWVGQWGALRYGVVGGATLSVLLGGRTTEGAPCACEQQPITFTDSTTTYRRTGLSMYAGAQAAYRLNARWSLLAQPSFHYFLTPTTQLGAALPRRRPWGAALQVGISLDLP